MVQCLGVLPLSDNTDWYQQYFAKEGASRHTEHAKVMKTLQREQLNYESIMASGMDVKKSYESLKILEMVFEEH